MAQAQREVCAVCGRRANRSCPALAGFICPACCGSQRGTKLECPAECTHFPFGTAAYDMLLKVDNSWQPKALKYVIGKVGKKEFMCMAEDFVIPWLDDQSTFIEGVSAALMYYLAIGDDDDAIPLGETWKGEGWPGLNNDERFLAEYRCRSLPGILEVQKILDGTAMECIDLLDKERGQFVVFDRNTATTVARFSKLVVWVTHYPHLSRLAGSGARLSELHVEPFLQGIRERAQEILGRKSDEDVKRYLAEFFDDVYELISVLSDEMRERLIASADADQCVASYKLLGPREEIESILEAKPDIELEENRGPESNDPRDARYYAWLRRGEAKAIEAELPPVFQHREDEEDGVGTLGTIRLSDSDLKLETLGRKKFEFAKKLISRYFKKRVERSGEKIIPIETLLEEAGQHENETADPSADISPEIPKQVMQKFYSKHYETFLDEPVPMVDNLTPRKAALVPGMRPKLIKLIKGHINQIENLRIEKGYDINIDWIIDELGLDELR